MAIPSWRANGGFSHDTASVTPALPTGHVAQDILLLVTETSGNAIVAPAGYVEVTGSNQVTTTTVTRMQCFWKRDNGAEAAPTVAAISDHIGAIIHAISGCEIIGNPWNITAGGIEDVSDASMSITGMTTTLNNCLIVGICTTETDAVSARFASEAAANLGSLAERSDDSTNNGDGGGIGVWTGTLATAGPTGTITANVTNSSRKAFMQIALKEPQAYSAIGAIQQQRSGTNIAVVSI